MRAGELRDRVTIQRVTDGVDSLEAPTQTFKDLVTMWANLSPSSGREFFDADSVEAQTTHRVLMRFVSGVTTKDRLIYKDRVLEIISVIDVDSLGKTLNLLCREVV